MSSAGTVSLTGMKLSLTTFLSLDGVYQGPGGPSEDTSGGFTQGGWLMPLFDEDLGNFMSNVFVPAEGFVLGRKTYEIFAAHWPYVKDPDDTIATRFNRVAKHVVTSSQAPLAWQNSTAVRGKVGDGIRRLKQQEGPTLLIQGSGQLVRALLAEDLIDEVTLFAFPMLLGKGKRFFGDDARPRALELEGSQVSTTGVVISSYARGGAIKTGSFAAEKPSEAEIARREKMKREG